MVISKEVASLRMVGERTGKLNRFSWVLVQELTIGLDLGKANRLSLLLQAQAHVRIEVTSVRWAQACSVMGILLLPVGGSGRPSAVESIEISRYYFSHRGRVNRHQISLNIDLSLRSLFTVFWEEVSSRQGNVLQIVNCTWVEIDGPKLPWSTWVLFNGPLYILVGRF
jgi:hypothetical protein